MLKTPSKSKYLDQSGAFVEGVQFSSTPQGIHLRTSGVYRVLWIKGEESETIELSTPLKLHPHRMILPRPDGIPNQRPNLDPVAGITSKFSPQIYNKALPRGNCIPFSLPCNGRMQSGEGEQRIENPPQHDLRNVRKIKHKAKIRFSQGKDDAGLPFLHFRLAVDGGQCLGFYRKGYLWSVENIESVAKKCRRHPTNLIPV